MDANTGECGRRPIRALLSPLTEAQIQRIALVDFNLREVVQELVALAGVVVVGSIGRVRTSRVVREWIRGKNLPADRERELRFALRLAMMIAQRQPGAVQAWFKGANPNLDNDAPAIVLARDFSASVQHRLLADARLFAS